MKRLHVNLSVRALDESVRFYSQLFDAEPTVVKPDYAKWSLDDPSVNFSLVEHNSTDAEHAPGIAHLGIEAETPQELEQLRQRLAGIDGRVEDEGETTCCYHESDKTWVTDGQGVAWETFHTSGEAATLHNPAAPTGPRSAGESGCCQDVDASASRTASIGSR